MTTRKIVTMPGDGIGSIVLPEALRVLDAAGFSFEPVEAEIGWECWRKRGNPLPARTLELLEQHQVGLFGAITSKPPADAARELNPELQGKKLVYYSPIVGLRQHFELDISIRPCPSFPGNPLNFIRRSMDGGIEEPVINAVIFRQNTEGLYAGVEWTNPPAAVREALQLHSKMKRFADIDPEDLAISTRIFTRGACRRIVNAAFAYAKKHGYRSVTVCEKPNVIRETSGMLLAEAREAQRANPSIELWNTNIDAQMMWMTKNPEEYGVVVSGNMFGDIVSDGFAGLVGGLGFAASANIGDHCAIFEPTHGSAPKYFDYPTSIVNPIAMILAACMMLEHLGDLGRAARIRRAVARVVAEGRVRTYDMLRLKGAPDVVERGAASTARMGDAIIAALEA